MSEGIHQQLQHHAERLADQLRPMLADAREHANGSAALTSALERVVQAAVHLADIAQADVEENHSHD